MRKAIIAAGLGAAILLTAGCSSSSKSTASQVSTTPPPTTPASALNESPQCAKGSLHLIGSTAFKPIAQQAADTYMNDCPGAAITVTGGDSDYGLTQVRDAVASHSPSAGSMIAMYDGLPAASAAAGLAPDPIGALVFSVVAHVGLYPGSNITSEFNPPPPSSSQASCLSLPSLTIKTLSSSLLFIAIR